MQTAIRSVRIRIENVLLRGQMLKYAHQNDELILLSSICFGRRKSFDVEENWISQCGISIVWVELIENESECNSQIKQ